MRVQTANAASSKVRIMMTSPSILYNSGVWVGRVALEGVRDMKVGMSQKLLEKRGVG